MFFFVFQAPIGDDNYLRMAAQLRTSAAVATVAAISDASGGQQGSVENQSAAPISGFFLDN